MLSPRYLHPTGQIPAYEWNFGDVNPPVHAVRHAAPCTRGGPADADGDGRPRLPRGVVPEAAAQLHLVGQPEGPGGPQPVRGRLPRPRQHRRVRPQRAAARRAAASSRPTARRGWRCSARTCSSWPSMLAEHGPELRGRSCSSSSSASSGSPPPSTRSATTPTRCGTRRTGFFYDVLRLPGRQRRARSRSARWSACSRCAPRRSSEPSVLDAFPHFATRVADVPASATATCSASIADPHRARRRRAAACCRSSNEDKLRRMLDPDARRGALPRPARHPLALALAPRPPVRAATSTVTSTGCTTSRRSRRPGMFGGNSNWRGPIWFPTNVLIIRALLQHYQYYGDAFTIECPTGSGQRDDPVRGGARSSPAGSSPSSCGTTTAGARSTAARAIFQNDPHWRDLTCSSTSTSTATTAPAWAPRTRPAGPDWWPG